MPKREEIHLHQFYRVIQSLECEVEYFQIKFSLASTDSHTVRQDPTQI